MRYYTQMNATGLNFQYVNIGPGDGLVPSGNKPLPEPLLIQVFVATWRHLATINLIYANQSNVQNDVFVLCKHMINWGIFYNIVWLL